MGQISLQIPQVGQANSTEDPKISNDFTTLQTLVNGNLDQSNVNAAAGFFIGAQKTATVNTTAAPGDWWLVRTGVTLTLPPATQSAVITVTGDTSVTPAAPAVVGGAGIQWNGTTITSFGLGAVSTVVLAGDGAGHWYMRSGGPDTGWVTVVSSPTAFSPAGSTLAYRQENTTVTFRGFAKVVSGVSYSWAAPSSAAAVLPGTYAGATVQISGGNALWTPTVTTNPVNFDGVFYRL